MEKSIQEIAALIGGTVCGDERIMIRDIRPIDEAGIHDLTFVANPKYFAQLATTGAGAVLVPPGTVEPGKNLIIVADPYSAFGQLLAVFHRVDHGPRGISPDAYIEKDASVSPDATVMARTYIGSGARIEKGAVVYPGVFIGRNVSIGEIGRAHV